LSIISLLTCWPQSAAMQRHTASCLACQRQNMPAQFQYDQPADTSGEPGSIRVKRNNDQPARPTQTAKGGRTKPLRTSNHRWLELD
jgi:hypothetical protein